MTSGWFCSPATPAVPRCPRLHTLCPGPPGKAPAATHQEGPVPSKCPFPDMPATSVMCVFSTTTRAKLMRVHPSESARWSGELPPPWRQKFVLPPGSRMVAGLELRALGTPPNPPTLRGADTGDGEEEGDQGQGTAGGREQGVEEGGPSRAESPQVWGCGPGAVGAFPLGAAARGLPATWTSQPSPSIPAATWAALPALPRTGHTTPRPTRTGHTSRVLTKPQWNFRTWR